MKKEVLRLLPILIIVMMVASCSSDDNEDQVQNNQIWIDMTRGELEAQESINAMSFRLLKALDDGVGLEKIPSNYIVSPQSLAWTLGMLANGAEGETLKEIIDFLGYREDASLDDINSFSSKLIKGVTMPNQSARVKVGNLAMSKCGEFSLDILPILKKNYETEIMYSPSEKQVSDYISRVTEGAIKGYSDDLNDDDTRIAFVNTFLFEGIWESTFSEFESKPMDFHNLDGTVSKPMFVSGEKQCMYGYNDMCHMLRLPFKKGYFYMNFIIPTDSHKFTDLKEYLNGQSWREILSSCSLGKMEIKIPRLKIDTDMDLSETVKGMGLKKAFRGDAEFGNMLKSGQDNLSLSKVKQMSSFSIDENGAKVVTQTVATLQETSAGAWKYYYLDEPFYFFITEESTDAILFIGKVTQL